MRTLQTARPGPELREFVRAYGQREITCEAAAFAQVHFAALEQCLSFELEDRMVLEHPDGRSEHCPAINAWGLLTHPFGRALFSGHIVGFAIFLKPSLHGNFFEFLRAQLQTFTAMVQISLDENCKTCGSCWPKSQPLLSVFV